MNKPNNLARRSIHLVIFAGLIIAAVLLIRALVISNNNQNHTFQEPENGPPKQYNPAQLPNK